MGKGDEQLLLFTRILHPSGARVRRGEGGLYAEQILLFTHILRPSGDDAREHLGHREPVDRLEQIRHPGRFIKVTVRNLFQFCFTPPRTGTMQGRFDNTIADRALSVKSPQKAPADPIHGGTYKNRDPREDASAHILSVMHKTPQNPSKARLFRNKILGYFHKISLNLLWILQH